jgi:two-component system, NarL family, response regulator NreC
MVTVVLADDHVVVRQGLRALLESDSQFSVVGEAADGPEAVAMVKLRKPKVLILDLMMPGPNGLETLRTVSRLKLDTRVVILTMYGREAYLIEALGSGAAGFVVKESCAAELFRAVQAVLAGRRYVSPTLLDASTGSNMRRLKAGLRHRQSELTTRERKILQLVVEGATNHDIAVRLKISSRTVASNRASFMGKLHLNTRRDLISYALQRGIVSEGQTGAEQEKNN